MTFLQIFDGRMVLIRALKHVLQNNRHTFGTGDCAMIPIFESPAVEEAFWMLERNLIALESEFAAKRLRKGKNARRALDRKADRQVEGHQRRRS